MKIIDFLLQIGKLKKIKRAGWLKHNIPNSESVAEHSFRVAVLGVVFAKRLGLDETKTIKMALFHDIAESEIGDIITQEGKIILSNLKEKLLLERKAFVKLLKLIDEEDQIKLLDEYNENNTQEAKLVRELDKLEMAIQAYEYETEHKVKLDTFFENSSNFIASEEIKSILEELENLRS